MQAAAAPTRKVPVIPERRAALRRRCDLEAYCRPATAASGDLWWQVKVRDISVRGIGLLSSFKFQTGQYLAIELSSRQQDFTRVVVASVARVEPTSGGWIIGCAFCGELAGEELADLLR